VAPVVEQDRAVQRVRRCARRVRASGPCSGRLRLRTCWPSLLSPWRRDCTVRQPGKAGQLSQESAVCGVPRSPSCAAGSALTWSELACAARSGARLSSTRSSDARGASAAGKVVDEARSRAGTPRRADTHIPCIVEALEGLGRQQIAEQTCASGTARATPARYTRPCGVHPCGARRHGSAGVVVSVAHSRIRGQSRGNRYIGWWGSSIAHTERPVEPFAARLARRRDRHRPWLEAVDVAAAR
jgi:hypothetical protein